MSENLKLFVWPEHQWGYSAGVCFALAHDEAEARALIRAHPDNCLEPEGPPEVHTGVYGFSRYGGS